MAETIRPDTNDKATQIYWNDLWRKRTFLRMASPYKSGPLNYSDRSFHILFKKWLSDFDGKLLLELGCAGSAWLPYFAKEYNLSVAGLDYSKLGCEHARIILEQEGVHGIIVEGNLFAPPLFMMNYYDIVVSFGLVEHFNDTMSAIFACSKFLKPGGLMITSIPNMHGCNGSLQKVIDREVFDMHVPLDKNALAFSHKHAGLNVLFCDYFMFFSIITNFSRIQSNHPVMWRLLKIPYVALNVLGWFIASVCHLSKPNPFLSPYIVCIAQKKK